MITNNYILDGLIYPNRKVDNNVYAPVPNAVDFIDTGESGVTGLADYLNVLGPLFNLDFSIITGSGFTGRAQKCTYNNAVIGNTGISFENTFTIGRTYTLSLEIVKSLTGTPRISIYNGGTIIQINNDANNAIANTLVITFTAETTSSLGIFSSALYGNQVGDFWAVGNIRVVEHPLILEYTLDNLTGSTVPDTSGNGFDGVNVGTTSGVGWFGEANKSRVFNRASQQRIGVDADFTTLFTNSYTIRTRVKFDNIIDVSLIVCFTSSTLSTSNNFLYLLQSGSSLIFQQRDNALNSSAELSYTITAGMWYDIVAIRDVDNIYLIVNGIVVGIGSAAAVGSTILERLTLGCIYSDALNNYVATRYFNGNINIVEIYNRPLTDYEIYAALHNPKD